MTTNVPYWGVGQNSPIDTQFTHADVSAHLLADWAPMLPTSASASFIGWAPFLMESHLDGKTDYLTLNKIAGRTERQWKVFLSWMLGVAGTRHVLAQEGYTWVAPLSAFYPTNVQAVDLTQWNPAFPPSRVSITRKPKSKSLLPDYIALRTPPGAKASWAIVESKGTSASLESMKCPAAWRQQVECAVVNVDGSKVKVQRHIVVATRSNPNAKRPGTRRLQIRAWNDDDDTSPEPAAVAEADIVAASLFGLCCSLQLRQNAIAIALAVEARAALAKAATGPNTEEDQRGGQLNAAADAELSQVLHAHRVGGQKWSLGRIERTTDIGSFAIQVEAATVNLIRSVRSERDEVRLAGAIRDTESELQSWRNSAKGRRSQSSEQDVADLPMGVEVRSTRRRLG